jgi:hypothetical protein
MGSSKAGKANAMRVGLGGLLRASHSSLALEALPEKWVELMNCIDENEKNRLKAEMIVQGERLDHVLKN